tara:strand:- start:8213 stop:8380 length:168 start_codon:yes stop_codon:yes gene_type:complete
MCQILSQVPLSLTISRIKKPRKEEKFDPKLVAAVEAKLRALDVESDVPLSGVEVA